MPHSIAFFSFVILLLLTAAESEVQNLLFNNDFNNTYAENGFIRYWSCQGEENTYRPVFQTMHNTRRPPFSGLCTERTNKSQGPSQLIQRMVVPDGMYKVQGWTLSLYGKTREENASIGLWLRWKEVGSEKEEKKLLAVRNKFLKNDDWVFWNSQFHLPGANRFQYVLIYFKGPPRHMDIIVDDMTLQKIPKKQNWKDESDVEIEKLRKRNVVLSVNFQGPKFSRIDLEKTKVEVKQLTSQFGFGASVYSHALKHNMAYRTFVKNNFEWVTMEHALKWPYMENEQGSVSYKVVDHMMDILIKEMGMNIRGHCIFWAVPEEQPKWLINASTVTVKASLKHRIEEVISRYKNRIDMWDVNNEMLHGAFFGDRAGEAVREWMFFEAHKLFPDGKFFVNDYEVLSAPYYTQSYIEQVEKFKSHGVPLSGIGVQGHFTGTVHPEILKDRLDSLDKLGLSIWITELDIKNLDEKKRAESLEKIMKVAFAHPAVHGILLWSFWDKHDWRGNTSLFVGPTFKPNAAGKRYLKLRNKWRSNLNSISPYQVTENETKFQFRVFHGTYLLRVTLPNNTIISKVIDVMPDSRRLVIVFRVHSL